MYLIGENCVSEKREDCFVQLLKQQYFHSKFEKCENCNGTWAYYAKVQKFHDLCCLIRSLTKGRWLNSMIYCIHKGKCEATDG